MGSGGAWRRAAAGCAGVVLAGGMAVWAAGPAQALTLPPGCSQPGPGPVVTCSQTYTGPGQYSFTVPAGVTQAQVALLGGSGGNGGNGGTTANPVNGGAGGAGAEVTGTVQVSGGEVLTVTVGGAGDDSALGGTGGYNGGGASGDLGVAGGGGGGATAVQDGTTVLLVAGGGGGGGTAPQGGNLDGAGGAGGNADSNGSAGGSVTAYGAELGGGQGGVAGTAGGTGGTGGTVIMGTTTCKGNVLLGMPPSPGEQGDAGQAGQGALAPGQVNVAGGGGGGGVFGGGQGGGPAGDMCTDTAGNGGGGGGSSYVASGADGVSGGSIDDTPTAPASLDGNGEAVISYTDTVALAQPKDITVDATSPYGALVFYRAPAATDTLGLTHPRVSCTPRSGRLFRIGTTTVTCTATDSYAGNSPARVSFQVTVLGVGAQLGALAAAVRGITHGQLLERLIAAAESELSSGRRLLASLTLERFILTVRLLEYQHALPPATARVLAADAARIIAVLGLAP